jgi:plasmid stability protein
VKNVTIALDDETHRRARIRAAELGTSLSALVKHYLATLGDGDSVTTPYVGVREMPLSFNPESALSAPVSKPKILRQPGSRAACGAKLAWRMILTFGQTTSSHRLKRGIMMPRQIANSEAAS